MILTNRLFERVPPSREARSIYIFCEGAKREFQYFQYFKELDSRINIEVYKLNDQEDNSPLGLLNIAKKCIIKSEDNPNPKYTFTERDEVWIVLDTDKDRDDSRKPQIEKIKEECEDLKDWHLAESNPCFEVWLYYHVAKDKPAFDSSENCSNWKELVNNSVRGGFDSRKHPIYIGKANVNAKNNFVSNNGSLDVGCTEIFNLGNSIYSLIEFKINQSISILNVNKSI